MAKKIAILTEKQIDHLISAANAMLAGEFGEGDSTGLNRYVMERAVHALYEANPAPNKSSKPTRSRATKSPVALFEYHTLYTLAQIETIAGQSATRSPGITHLPNQASVLGREGEQYDFCGHDDDHLILLWIDDQRSNL